MDKATAFAQAIAAMDTALHDLAGSKLDLVFNDDSHTYWSTHCRHGNHEACAAVELAPGVPRMPAQCKTCGSPCVCACHQILLAA